MVLIYLNTDVRKKSPMEKSKIYKVLVEDVSMAEVIEQSKNIKELFIKTSERVNKEIDRLTLSHDEVDYKYCVLNNIGCGNFEKISVI